MGLFNFFKKKKKESKIEEISKDELKNWVSNKDSKIIKEKSELLNLVKEKISTLISELNNQIDFFQTIDIESKTPNHRASAMAKENLKNYELYLTKLIERLNEINNIDNLIENINTIIKDFETKSNISYQKISALLGKEVKGAKNQLRLFLKEIENILKSNEKRLEEFENFEIVKKKIQKIDELKKALKESEENLEDYQRQRNELLKKIKKKEKEIFEIKNSEKYKRYRFQEKTLQKRKELFEKELLKLKSLIDFKTLTSFYHKFEGEMELVKKYKDNFNETVSQAGFSELLKLLKESNQLDNQIGSKIEKLKNEKEEMLNFKIDKISFNEIEKEIEEEKTNLQNIKMQIDIEKRKNEDLMQDILTQENLMKVYLKKMDVEIKDSQSTQESKSI